MSLSTRASGDRNERDGDREIPRFCAFAMDPKRRAVSTSNSRREEAA